MCSVQARMVFAAAVMLFSAFTTSFGVRGQASSDKNNPQNQAGTTVTMRWGARPGVSRYRLQLAADPGFTDIVFDRVVRGQAYTTSDLAPGKYFWRVAALTTKLGAFSSAGVIEVAPDSQAVRDSTASSSISRSGAVEPTSAVKATGGWFTAVGGVAKTILAHLRMLNRYELVTTTDDGRVVAVDADTGYALWTVRPQTLRAKTSTTIPLMLPLVITTHNGLDNVLLLGDTATLLDGRTGRTLWQTNLPSFISRATVSGDKVLAIDSSLLKLLVVSAIDGRVLSDLRLPRPAVGAPTPFVRNGTRAVAIALDDGRLYLLDEFGKLMLEGNAGAAATTAPLIVRTPRGELVLVGTSFGLIALDADDLHPLGRVTFKNDHPRGVLLAPDLDRDGVAEVVTFTGRGRVVVVKSDEGKIVWEADAKQADATAFADINGDGALDLLMTGREEFAFALSGRDGMLIWKSDSLQSMATNHASQRVARAPFVVPTASGMLLIAGDANGSGLRALEFNKRPAPPR